MLIGLIILIGSIFAGMNTMYAAVSGRVREIGTLKALGFTRLSLLVSFVCESLLLALAGGVLGALLSFALTSWHLTFPWWLLNSALLDQALGLWLSCHCLSVLREDYCLP
jgi:ABC-type antimicrobial peptide transport system permease subunit